MILSRYKTVGIPCLGFGLYLAWLSLVFHENWVISSPDLYSFVDDPFFVFLAISNFIFAMIGILPERFTSILRRKSSIVLSSSLTCIGTLIILFYGQSSFVVAAGILAGLTAPIIQVCWGEVFASMDLRRTMTSTAAAFVLAALVRILVTVAGEPVLKISAIILPALCCLLLLVSTKSMSDTKQSLPVEAARISFEDYSQLQFVIEVVVCSLVFGVFFGISRFAMPDALSFNHLLLYIIATDLLGGVIFILWALLSKRKLTSWRLYQPITALMISGVALLPFLGTDLISPPMILVSLAWVYLTILIWIILSDQASRTTSRMQVFARGEFLTNVTMLVVTIIGTILYRQFNITQITLTIYALILVYVLAMSVTVFRNGWRTHPRYVPNSSETLPSTDYTQMQAGETGGTAFASYDLLPIKCKVLTDTYHLSKRESDVLLLLVRGFNAGSIGTYLSLSRNTTKTHIQHIYDKIGINSQQELLRIIEESELDLPVDSTTRPACDLHLEPDLDSPKKASSIGPSALRLS